MLRARSSKHTLNYWVASPYFLNPKLGRWIYKLVYFLFSLYFVKKGAEESELLLFKGDDKLSVRDSIVHPFA